MAVSKSGSSSNSSSSESPLFGTKSKVTYDGYEKVKKHGNNDDYNNGNGADDKGYNKILGLIEWAVRPA